jgi:prepilin-type N-terminal cleavage/methylation domain-containing protein
MNSVRKYQRRAGFTLIEFVVAMLLFGVAMSGVVSLVVMQARTLTSLEQGPKHVALHPNPDTSNSYRTEHTEEWHQVATESDEANAGEWVHKWYLVPNSHDWGRKLGSAALLTSNDPGPKVPPPAPTPANLTADDGDDGHTEVGTWISDPNSAAHSADQRRFVYPEGQITGDAKAVWTFTNVPAGWYQVQATWLSSPDQAADAAYTLYDSGELLTDYPVAPVDQRNLPIPPEGAVAESSLWQVLQTAYFATGTATVELSGLSAIDPAAYVVADGVRLVLVENSVEIESFERSAVHETEQVSVRVKVEPK